MKRLINILYLLSFILFLSSNSTAGIEIKEDFRLASIEFEDMYQNEIYSPTGENYYLRSNILISELNISHVSAEDLKCHLTHYLVFDEKGKSKFAEMTAKSMGKHLALLFNSKIISDPFIRDAIKDGLNVIKGDFSLEEAKKYTNDLMKE